MASTTEALAELADKAAPEIQAVCHCNNEALCHADMEHPLVR